MVSVFPDEQPESQDKSKEERSMIITFFDITVFIMNLIICHIRIEHKIQKARNLSNLVHFRRNHDKSGRFLLHLVSWDADEDFGMF